MPQNDTLQHYQIQRHEDGSLWELGRGAMGVTYKAFDVNLRCPVALKLVNGVFLYDESARMRFVREARAAAGLRHRNVASVHHLSADGDDFFYAMEFIDGETVSAWVRRAGRLPTVTALRITLQVARALGAAHKRGLVHRDVKPANLMVVHEDDDEHFVVKLIDFGLVRVFREADAANPPSTNPTLAGFVGTPLFASPEQLEERELDTRSDIYSLGLTLWFMLTGQTPFTGTLAQLCLQHVTQGLPWERLAGMPEPLLVLMRRMLEKDPGQRPQDPTELRALVTAGLRAVLAAEPGAGAEELEDEGMMGNTRPSALPAAPFPPPAAGMLLSNGLRLGVLVGEGSRGRVFQADDPRREGGTVAVKVFHHGVMGNEADFERLRGLAALARARPHPNMLEIVALERHQHFNYLETEWVNGCTLVHLLGKRGRMTVADCLRLLRPAVSAASHARAHGLPAVELALHQILVHFPDGVRGDDPAAGVNFDLPLTEWPEFRLKFDPMSDAVGGGALATWSGEATLVRDPRGVRGPESGGGRVNVRPLGILVYDLLGGAAASSGRAGEPRRPMARLLGEAGNTVLRQAVSASPGFVSEEEFFRALAESTGLDPQSLQPRQTLPETPAPARPQKPEEETRPTVLAVPASVIPARPVQWGKTLPGGRLQRWSVDTLTRTRTRLRRCAPDQASTAGFLRRRAAVVGLTTLGLVAVAILGWFRLNRPRTAVAIAPGPSEVVRVPPPERTLAVIPVPTTEPPSSTVPAVSTSEPAVATPPVLPEPPMEAPGPATPGAGSEEVPGVVVTGLPQAEGATVGEPLPASAPLVHPGVPATAQTAVSPGPAALEPGATDLEESNEGKPELKKSSTRSRTSSRGSSRRQRQRRPQPNLIQRIFGIRPK